MGRSRLALVLALMSGALPAGCVEDVRFNPSGCAVHVRGRWLVDGENPNSETCGNIALVELAIINDPEDEFWIAPEFSVLCDGQNDPNVAIIDGGAYIDTMIVTRNRCGGSGKILENPPASEYKSRWRGTTSRQFVVDCTPIVTTEITGPEQDLLLDLGTIDLQTRDGGAVCPPEP